MTLDKKLAALVAGSFATLAAVTLAVPPVQGQQGGTIQLGRDTNVRPGKTASGVETLVIEDNVSLHWIDKSKVSALTEGVIRQMEMTYGKPVREGKPIGYLHDEMAKIAVAKADLTYKMQSPMKKAKAQFDLAIANLARSRNLAKRGPNYVSAEEIAKQEAEVTVAEAMMIEADEKRKIDEADLQAAQQKQEDHVIKAPFDGVVINVLKHPGESVKANEPVVEVGKLEKLRADGYVPLQYVYKIKEGMRVDAQPILQGARGEAMPLESKVFRGKVTFIDPEIQAVGESAVRVFAEFENPTNELRPGMNVRMTIYMAVDDAQPTAGIAPAGVPR